MPDKDFNKTPIPKESGLELDSLLDLHRVEKTIRETI